MHDPGDDDLLARLRAAEAAVRARDDFLAIAAHELRSPLNALALRLATLELMAGRAGQGALHEEIGRTRRTVDRYVRRAVVLLDVSRLNAAGMALSREWVSVGEVVRNVVDTHGDEAAFHGTAIDAEVQGESSGFWDPHMVEEILGNLVNNAIKYGNRTPVHLRAWVSGGRMAHFEVSDSGPGIDAAERARIFEKFERVVSTARDRAGFGLGLWIVGRMVAAHGGAIEVTSPPEGGSRFLVTLPLQPDPVSRKDPAT